MQFETVVVKKRIHVLVYSRREYVPAKPPKFIEIPKPNYMDTGMALVGVLKPHESINDFAIRWK